MIRKGREFYAKNYSRVMELHAMGVPPAGIAKQMNMSYSAVYHWIRGLRKPGAGNITGFESFLEKHGPMAAAEIRDAFPKHNEIFLTAAGRGSPLKRHVMDRKFGEYATWYLLPGQEPALKARIEELLGKYKELRNKIAKMIESV